MANALAYFTPTKWDEEKKFSKIDSSVIKLLLIEEEEEDTK